MLTKQILLEFSFVILLFQICRLKSYIDSSKYKKNKYSTYESNRIDMEGVLGRKTINRLTLILSGLFILVYIAFYLIGFKLFIGTNLVIFPILLTILILFEYTIIILDTIKSRSMNKPIYSLIDKTFQPANTAYLIYFVWYVLKHNIK